MIISDVGNLIKTNSSKILTSQFKTFIYDNLEGISVSETKFKHWEIYFNAVAIDGRIFNDNLLIFRKFLLNSRYVFIFSECAWNVITSKRWNRP